MGNYCLPNSDLLMPPSTILPSTGQGHDIDKHLALPIFPHRGNMITIDIIDEKDHVERLRILGSDVGIAMTMAITTEMSALENESTGLNNYLDDMSIHGIGATGSGTAIYCMIQLLSLEKEVFWHHVHNVRKALKIVKDKENRERGEDDKRE